MRRRSPLAFAALIPLIPLIAPALAAAAPPPPVSPATLDTVLEALARDVTQGRDNLTPGNALARSALVDFLVGQDVDPGGDGAGFVQVFAEGSNIIAVHHPPGTAGQGPRVLLGAHYDHLGYDCTPRPEAASAVCNGASDNAGGVAAALGALEALAGSVRYPVAVALWDAEEDGKLGSQFFAANPSIDLSQLRLYINLDIVGSNLFRGGEELHFAVGAETGGPDLVADVAASAEGLPLTLGQVSFVFGMARSDSDSFVFGGYDVPIVFFGDSDGSIYHSTADELVYLNTAKVEAVANAAARLAEVAADRPDPYPWVDPLRDGILPIYSDVQPVLSAWRMLLRHARDNELSAEDTVRLTHMAQVLQRMVDDGPEAFGAKDALRLVDIATWGTDLSRSLPFVP